MGSQELGPVEQSLRNWVKAPASGKLTAPGANPATPEQMEPYRPGAENLRLKMYVDLLGKATA